jgi:hypothetical protein
VYNGNVTKATCRASTNFVIGIVKTGPLLGFNIKLPQVVQPAVTCTYRDMRGLQRPRSKLVSPRYNGLRRIPPPTWTHTIVSPKQINGAIRVVIRQDYAIVFSSTWFLVRHHLDRFPHIVLERVAPKVVQSKNPTTIAPKHVEIVLDNYTGGSGSGGRNHQRCRLWSSG